MGVPDLNSCFAAAIICEVDKERKMYMLLYLECNLEYQMLVESNKKHQCSSWLAIACFYVHKHQCFGNYLGDA